MTVILEDKNQVILVKAQEQNWVTLTVESCRARMAVMKED